MGVLSIRGPSCRLELLSMAHAEPLARVAGCERVAVPAGIPHPLPIGWAQRLCAARLEDAQHDRAIAFAVFGDGVVGYVGLVGMKRYVAGAELSIWLAASCWGKGIGASAVRAVLGFAFQGLKLARVYGCCSETNARGQVLLGSCGFSSDRSWMPSTSAERPLLGFSVSHLDWSARMSRGDF